ncbi:PREDICTED: metacaspase-3 [Tarenaya hassleriana]|uniref:metacaspase-3 n=1 Tax=Tarenaya hassleriana TaxID=28532 RepID=UPI00053C2C51|nr:PREDICTED: metacaspase-3 [Tarenaya hassleriana]
MASRMEVRCTCGQRMWTPPGIQSLQCSACNTFIRLSLFPVPGTRSRPFLPPSKLVSGSNHVGYYSRRLSEKGSSAVEAGGRLPSAFGRKRAVLCGLNYRGTSYALKGCITDAKSMRSFLIHHMGFPPDSILMLTEEEPSSQRFPTKKNMRKAMRWLVEGNRAGDSLVFHFSGHGSRQKDYNGDEIDGQDEALCPLDQETEGKIIDDEINQTLVRPLVPGAKLHAIIDACYSGTVLDLPFVCRMARNGYYKWEDQRSMGAYKGSNGGVAYCFSACDDHETSGYTPVFTGKNTGAMTYSFIKAVKADPSPTYGGLLSLMCSAIRDAQNSLSNDGAFAHSDEPAEPLLSSSEKFDIYKKKFVL